MSSTSCPICSQESYVYTDESRECQSCGKFKITNEAIDALKHEPYKNQTAKISSFLRGRDLKGLPPLTIFLSVEEAKKYGSMAVSLEDIISNFPKNISDRIDNVLINLSRLSKYTGDFVNLGKKDISIFYCDSYEINAFCFILKQLYYDDLVEDDGGKKWFGLPIKLRLTAKGWNRVNELEKGTLDNPRNVFVAMSFDQSLNNIYENAIKKSNC